MTISHKSIDEAVTGENACNLQGTFHSCGTVNFTYYNRENGLSAQTMPDNNLNIKLDM